MPLPPCPVVNPNDARGRGRYGYPPPDSPQQRVLAYGQQQASRYCLPGSPAQGENQCDGQCRRAASCVDPKPLLRPGRAAQQKCDRDNLDRGIGNGVPPRKSEHAVHGRADQQDTFDIGCGPVKTVFRQSGHAADAAIGLAFTKARPSSNAIFSARNPASPKARSQFDNDISSAPSPRSRPENRTMHQNRVRAPFQCRLT